MRNSSASLPFPNRIARAGLTMMLIFAAASAALAYQTTRESRILTRSVVVVITDAQRLRRIAQVSQLTVQLAVRTRDSRYIAGHREEERNLERTLRDLIRSIVLPANARTADQVRVSSQQLAAMENQAVELALSGRSSEAERILRSPAYQNLSKTRFDDLGLIRDRALTYSSEIQSHIERNSWLSVLASLAGLPIIFFAWLLILGPARRWAKRADQARSAAEESVRAKSRFVAVVSHEIRAPLTAIIGFTELLSGDSALTQWQRKRVGFIRQAGAALLAVVNDVLDLSALEVGKLRMHEDRLSVPELIQSAMMIVEQSAESKGLSLKTDLDRHLPEAYFGDFQRLRQILINLLSNAVKFTSAGWVQVSVIVRAELPVEDRVRFIVRDSGCGIDPDKQGILFQSFSQVGSGGLGSPGGTGLGLWISKRLVEYLGGEIGFASSPGEGSTFWFEVPLRREPTKFASTAASPPANQPSPVA